MANAALPLRHQMKHVLALPRHARLLARGARERHLQLRKHWQIGDGVLDLEKSRVEAAPQIG